MAGIQRTTPRLWSKPAAWLVLLLCFALSVWAWHYVREQVQARAEQYFAFRVAQITTAMEQRMAAYELVLRAAAGLLRAAGPLSEREWHRYVEQLDLSRHYPGLVGLGYVVPTPREHLPELIARARQQVQPDYAVYPWDRTGAAAPVLYHAGRVPLPGLGYDFFSEARYRDALRQAAATAQPTLTAAARLPDGSWAVTLLIPVYSSAPVSDRAEMLPPAPEGYAYAVIRVRDLAQLAAGARQLDVYLALYEGVSETGRLLHGGIPAHARDTVLSAGAAFAMGGRDWALRVHARAPLDEALLDLDASEWVLGGGVLVSLLLFALFWSMASVEQRATVLAGRMQGALEEANRKLEQRVVERTEALRAKTAELERSNAELEQFAYVVSHDLQEPLRSMTGFAQLLERDYGECLQGRGQGFLRHLGQGAERMQRLVMDLLLYSRVGAQPRPLVPVELGEVLDEALENLAARIGERGGIVRRDGFARVLGDRLELVQLFQNLIGNSLKFNESAPPCVQVLAEPAHEFVQVAVRDNGIGIDARDFERIFQIFQRGNAAQSGTGIGLALCRKIVERHGGRIWLESQPGRGTTFYFTLRSACP